MKLAALPGPFGREVTDVDVPALSDVDLAALLHALYDNRFLVLRTGGLTKDELIAFAYRIGDPLRFSDGRDRPEIIPITNVDTDTRESRRGAAHWHTDQSFRKTLASVTMLYSVATPERGGETRFCDMVAAYEALDPELRARVEQLVAEHRHGVSISALPDDHTPEPPKGWDPDYTVRHPLVRAHPITGTKALYAITGTAQGIVGLPRDEAKALLDRLCAHALSAPFLNAHRHRVHDLVMWDNPTTLHSATPIGRATGPADTRVIHRISLRGTPSVFA